MIKRYKIFEQIDDPYGEEVDEFTDGKDEFDVEDLEFLNGNAETKFTLNYKLFNDCITFEVFYDDMGYNYYEIYNKNELPENIINLLEEYNDEIRIKLQEDIRNGRF
jgi:hypothetical protein